MLPNLQVVVLFIYLVIKSFEKIFMRHLIMGYIIVYYITIIPNIFDNMVHSMEFHIVKSWSI